MAQIASSTASMESSSSLAERRLHQRLEPLGSASSLEPGSVASVLSVSSRSFQTPVKERNCSRCEVGESPLVVGK